MYFINKWKAQHLPFIVLSAAGISGIKRWRGGLGVTDVYNIETSEGGLFLIQDLSEGYDVGFYVVSGATFTSLHNANATVKVGENTNGYISVYRESSSGAIKIYNRTSVARAISLIFISM